MTGTRLAGLILVIVGVLGLVYGRITYGKETAEATLGPISVSVEEKKSVNVPMWAGIAAIIVGAGLLLVPVKR